MLRECVRFASGSKIIITTREEKQLVALQEDCHLTYYNYKVKELDEHESRELFYQLAFKRNKPKEDYSELVDQFICYAKGLPLTLKIIGFDLHERNIRCWKVHYKQGFETRTRPYGPTGKTSNRSFLWFF